jgi:hypothetical protein
VKRFTAIILATTILFSQTELRQLQKLPFMAKHFLQHNERGMSLSQFIIHHYFSGDTHYSDYQQDLKLPFKSHDSSQSTTLTLATPAKESTALPASPPIAKNQFALYNGRIPVPRPADIWQPPKLA